MGLFSLHICLSFACVWGVGSPGEVYIAEEFLQGRKKWELSHGRICITLNLSLYRFEH